MKVMTVLGARPQFIKAATVSRAIDATSGINEVIVHTGQHFDANMSAVFFRQMDIPEPLYNLQISGLGHGAMTGRMIEAIEKIVIKEKPDWVLVYGDTNSTLAAALAAVKLHFPVAHVEAGLRSKNPYMPEEINRILTDRVSSLLLCPTSIAEQNLKKEGFPFCTQSRVKLANSELCPSATGQQKIVNVGDVMYDATLRYRAIARDMVRLPDIGISSESFILCTVHRQENTDDPTRLATIFKVLLELAKDEQVVVPLHPRTLNKLGGLKNVISDSLILLEPVPYLEMQRLLMQARIVVTDSGGLQKEAFFNGVPCVTLRSETEWIETVELGWNTLVDIDEQDILSAVKLGATPKKAAPQIYGDGTAATRVVRQLLDS